MDTVILNDFWLFFASVLEMYSYLYLISISQKGQKSQKVSLLSLD